MLYYLSHSAKGSTWKKHKYIKKENGRYYYPSKGGNIPKPDTAKSQLERTIQATKDMQDKADEFWAAKNALDAERRTNRETDRLKGEADWLEKSRRALRESSLKYIMNVTSKEMDDLYDLINKSLDRRLTKKELLYNNGKYY